MSAAEGHVFFPAHGYHLCASQRPLLTNGLCTSWGM
jgi:hypothetical protein